MTLRKNRKAVNVNFESIAYGFFSAIFVLIFDLAKFSLKTPCPPDFSCDNIERGFPPGGVLIGAVFSAIFVNFFLCRIAKSDFTKWLLILALTSITAILMQTVYFICKTDLAFEELLSTHFSNEIVMRSLGLNLMLELFIILIPLTLLFANRHFIIEKIKNSNSLK